MHLFKDMSSVTCFLIAAMLAVAPCSGESFSGEVVGVSDGDTIKVMHNGQAERIRLNGIDAPEKSQAFGQKAKEFASSLCFGKLVEVVTPDAPKDKDRYGRTIGDVHLPDGKDLNNEIVSVGLAWWYRKYAPNNIVLQQLEKQARDQHLGLWADADPQAPWDYRQAQKNAKSAARDQRQVDTKDGAQASGQPLQGKVEDKSGGVSAGAPLQGKVEDKDAPSGGQPLQGQVDKGGGVSSGTPLQGKVEDKDAAGAGQPLTAHIQDTALKGKVEGDQTGGDLQALSPQGSAIMHIVQFRQDSVNQDAARASAPAWELHPQTPQQRPLRGAVDDVTQPVRKIAVIEQAPKRDELQEQQPARDRDKRPVRQESEVLPVRTAAGVEQRPVRTVSEMNGLPPVRIVLGGEQAPQRAIADTVQTEQVPVRTEIEPGQREQRVSAKKEKVKKPRRERVSIDAASATAWELHPQKPHQRPVSDVVPLHPLSEQEQLLLWDRWYAHVNELVCRALTETMRKEGNPAGSDLVHITVWPDHRLQVSLVQAGNAGFDRAVLAAYASLSGDGGLEFPRGTQRGVVDYETAHRQEVAAPTALFDSSTIHGDLERIR